MFTKLDHLREYLDELYFDTDRVNIYALDQAQTQPQNQPPTQKLVNIMELLELLEELEIDAMKMDVKRFIEQTPPTHPFFDHVSTYLDYQDWDQDITPEECDEAWSCILTYVDQFPLPNPLENSYHTVYLDDKVYLDLESIPGGWCVKYTNPTNHTQTTRHFGYTFKQLVDLYERDYKHESLL